MPGRSFDSPSSRSFAPARLRPDPPPAVALLPAVSRLDVPAEASSAVTARSLTPPLSGAGLIRGRHADDDHSLTAMADPKLEMDDLDPPRRAHLPAMVPISSPRISPSLCVWYLYIILLLPLQNREVAELHAWSCWIEGKTKAAGRRESCPPTKASCWIPTQRSCIVQEGCRLLYHSDLVSP
jgi:hypothetical protein